MKKWMVLECSISLIFYIARRLDFLVTFLNLGLFQDFLVSVSTHKFWVKSEIQRYWILIRSKYPESHWFNQNYWIVLFYFFCKEKWMVLESIISTIWYFARRLDLLSNIHVIWVFFLVYLVWCPRINVFKNIYYQIFGGILMKYIPQRNVNRKY